MLERVRNSNQSLEAVTCHFNASLEEVLKKIDLNEFGICIIIDSNFKLFGTITDGDIRRALLKGATLKDEVSNLVNKDCVYLNHNSSTGTIVSHLSNKIKCIPLVDDDHVVVDYASSLRLKRIPIQEPLMQGNEMAYVADCIRTNWISSQGKYVLQFEQMLCELNNANYCLAVSNGTVALHLALVSLGIGPGDEVIIPDITFAATINAVLYTGATPVLVDVDKSSWNIDTQSIISNISNKTKAIIPVHLYGVPAEMDVILEIASEYNLFVVEDAAEAIGSSYKGTPCGSMGDIGTFSFFGNKTITTGEGGAILFKNESTYLYARQLRDHGMSSTKKYWHEVVGYNYRLTNLQAAVGVAQLENFNKIISAKQNIFNWYRERMSTDSSIRIQNSPAHSMNSCWLFSLVHEHLHTEADRNKLIDGLSKRGIDTRPLFYPLGDMPLYQKYRKGTTEISQKISYSGLSLPSYVSLTEADVDYICSSFFEEVNKLDVSQPH